MASRLAALIGVALFYFAPAALGAQAVLLQIHPRVGDTMIVRMDQKVEVTGVPTGCVTGYAGTRKTQAPDERPRNCSESTRQMTTVMEVFSRAIISASSIDGARVLAITDSVRTGLASGSQRSPRTRRVSPGRESMQLSVATDGETELVDSDVSAELRAVFGQMPATLSRRPVAVGEKWVRQMRIPISAEAGASGLVRATFRLDSLGRNGDVAYISMSGTLSHDHTDGSDSELEGWLSGTIRLDRRLAWITHTNVVIDAESTIAPKTGGQRMRVRTKITQVLRSRPVR